MLKVNLNNVHASTDQTPSNIVYFMGPYSQFCREKNPLLVIHDLKHGLYLLDLSTTKKTQILYSKNDRNLSGPKTWRTKRSPEQQETTSSDESENEKTSETEDEIGPNWNTRFQNCSFCSLGSIPSQYGVTVLHQTRQMIVVF